MGGYTSFSADITYYLKDGENDLTLRVYNPSYAKETVRGKQLWSDGEFGCWYKRYTGIWQPVWIEAVGKAYLKTLSLVSDVDDNSVTVKALFDGLCEKDISNVAFNIEVNGREVANASFKLFGNYLCEKISVGYDGSPFRGSEWWSPEHPTLYLTGIKLSQDGEVLDELQTYFGVKKCEISEGKYLLNNFPFYHRSVLYQGYYPEGYITAEDDERIISDIKLLKSMGYNAIRIHQKVESSKFLYYCDKLGMAIWEEFPSMYEYREFSFHDIFSQLTDIVTRDISHPSINAWVMFNESWGIQQVRFDKKQQDLSVAAYRLIKSVNPERPVISNDGWQQTETDIVTIHDYSAYGDEISKRYENQPEIGKNFVAGQRRFAFAEGYTYSGQAVMLTEYGGISYSKDEGWGYNGKVTTEEEFLKRFESLTKAIKEVPYICGYCFTQFTDVENEQNGLLTIDREPKASLDKIKAINLK